MHIANTLVVSFTLTMNESFCDHLIAMLIVLGWIHAAADAVHVGVVLVEFGLSFNK